MNSKRNKETVKQNYVFVSVVLTSKHIKEEKKPNKFIKKYFVEVKVALRSDGAERRWMRQAVMGVLRWRDLPGTRNSTNGTLRSLQSEVKIIMKQK